MKIISVMILLLAFAIPIWAQEATPETTETPAMDSVPALDATYCIGGLQFNYPSSWAGVYPVKPISTNNQSVISVALINNRADVNAHDDNGVYIGIDVYQNSQLLDLFYQESQGKGDGFTVLSEILNYFSDFLTQKTLEELDIPAGGEKILYLKAMGSVDEQTYTLLSSGIVIRTGFITTYLGNYIPWHDTVSAILDTISYEPNTSCPIQK